MTQEAGAATGGFSRLILATIIGGVAGYVITWLVPRAVGFAEYAEFAVFWGFLFLMVSALSGIQQEVTRATRPATTGSMTRALIFGAVVSVAVLALILGTAPLWVEAVFPTTSWALVLPAAIGAASYVGVAVVGGALYGLAQWGAVFWLISTEALLRLVAVGAILLFSNDIVVIAWAVALPFPLTLILLSRLLFPKIWKRAELDVDSRQLTWNVVRTIAAAASMGVLISGMPMLLGIAAGGESKELVGLVIITITFTRAPLIVVMMALQSYFIVLFKNAGSAFWKTYLTLSGAVVLGGGVLGLLGFLVGPWVFSLLFPGEIVPSAEFVSTMVVSSALVALLCLSSPAVLVRSQHFVYTAGWIVAAVTTVVILALPIAFMARVVLALFLGPAAGLLVHCTYLVAAAASARRGSAPVDAASTTS